MSIASKRFPHLSPTVAQARLEAVEYLVDNLDYTEEECSNMSLKDMQRIIGNAENLKEINGEN